MQKKKSPYSKRKIWTFRKAKTVKLGLYYILMDLARVNLGCSGIRESRPGSRMFRAHEILTAPRQVLFLHKVVTKSEICSIVKLSEEKRYDPETFEHNILKEGTGRGRTRPFIPAI